MFVLYSVGGGSVGCLAQHVLGMDIVVAINPLLAPVAATVPANSDILHISVSRC